MVYYNNDFSWSWGDLEFRGPFRIVPNWGKGAEPLRPDHSLVAGASCKEGAGTTLDEVSHFSQGQFLEKDSSTNIQQLMVLATGGIIAQSWREESGNVSASTEVDNPCISWSRWFLIKNPFYLGTGPLELWSTSFPRETCKRKFNGRNYSAHWCICSQAYLTLIKSFLYNPL